MAEIRAMKDRGELYHNPDAPEGPDLPDSFWANAKVVYPQKATSVHLRLDPEVYEYFRATSGGKGHITRMQAVLKAYVEAHKKGLVPPDQDKSDGDKSDGGK